MPRGSPASSGLPKGGCTFVLKECRVIIAILPRAANFPQRPIFYRSGGRVVRASASGAVDSGLISIRVKPTTVKLVFTASLLDAQHRRDSVENKPASLLVRKGT